MAFKSRKVDVVGNGGSKNVTTNSSLNKNISVDKNMKAVSKSEKEIESYRLHACEILDILENEHGVDFYADDRTPGMYLNMSRKNGNKLNLKKVYKKEVSISDNRKLSLIEKLKNNGKR